MLSVNFIVLGVISFYPQVSHALHHFILAATVSASMGRDPLLELNQMHTLDYSAYLALSLKLKFY